MCIYMYTLCSVQDSYKSFFIAYTYTYVCVYTCTCTCTLTFLCPVMYMHCMCFCNACTCIMYMYVYNYVLATCCGVQVLYTLQCSSGTMNMPTTSPCPRPFLFTVYAKTQGKGAKEFCRLLKNTMPVSVGFFQCKTE